MHISRLPFKIAVIGAAIWVVSQSFTLSLPFTVRVVDATTRGPVAGAIAFARWKSHVVTLAGANPGPTLIARAAVSDAQGRIAFPMSFVVHRPFAPFSWYARDWGHFPQLLIIARDYELDLGTSDWIWTYPTVLFGAPPIVVSTLRDRTIALTPVSVQSPERSVGELRLKNDELAFTAQGLSVHERCTYVPQARQWFLAVHAKAFPREDWRNTEFELLLADCK